MPNLPGELAEALIGCVFVVIAVESLVAGFAARPRRAPIAIWFGVFALLYGIRLGARSDLFRLATMWPRSVFAYTDAFITYSILVPAGLFVEMLTGPGIAGLVRRSWQVGLVYAAGAILNDLIQGRPAATMWLNAPVVLLMVSLFVWHTVGMAQRVQRWTREATLVSAAGLLFIAVAFYETVFQRPPLGIPFNVEPLAMLLLTIALGWFVLTRVGGQAAEYAAISRELQLARDIQQSLVPRQMPQVPGLRLAGAYMPMSAVAGDFYDVAVRPDGTMVVIVADVSGHGVPAALIASMVKVAFGVEVERESDPAVILAGINRALTGKFDRAYVTACCVVLPSEGGRLAYGAAGHPPALLRRAEGVQVRLEEGGVALTLLPSATYASTEVRFGRGDRLFLYTDGLLEASRPGHDEFFGDAELARAVAALDDALDPAAALVDACRRWIGPGSPLADDVTLVVIDRL